MIYTLKIERMEFRAPHGCYDLEKKVGNNYEVDLTLDIEVDNAVEADDVSGTVDYVEVYQAVRTQMRQPSNIIENAALRILNAVLESFPQVRRAEVTVSKLAPPIGGKAAKTSVTISRPNLL